MVTPASGVSPGDIGIDLRNNSASTSSLNVFITASTETRDVTLRASLRRIEEGTYGVCTECGVDIPFERLTAAPLAHRCIDCQAIAEKRERTFGGEG